MKIPLFLISIWIALSPTINAKDLGSLKILYVGERADSFVPFLKSHVAQVMAEKRSVFIPTDATPFDVVLLDWPQTGKPEDFPPQSSPLGARADWHKPTVLLGSAGLNLAVVWELQGGSGCTCLSPLAYGLHDHEIFRRPFKIDLTKTVDIPTPPAFGEYLKDTRITVLPLVDDYGKEWNRGWCTYSESFSDDPDVEYFCGGVNEKTPTAAALWRQGNLLHFGFEQSPAEMDEIGQEVLLNAIVYISRFSQDAPIAVIPSIFAGPISSSPERIMRHLKANYPMDVCEKDFEPELGKRLASLDRTDLETWMEGKGRFLHPNLNRLLEVDDDLLAWGVPFKEPKFIDKALDELSAGGIRANRAQRLLARYVPSGPDHGSSEEWKAWWQVNRSYAFPSDFGEYRWYIDPLAKERGVPTRELRGAARADIGPE